MQVINRETQRGKHGMRERGGGKEGVRDKKKNRGSTVQSYRKILRLGRRKRQIDRGR